MGKLFEAVNIPDRDVLKYLMQSLCEIAKVNYDYIEEYITNIG